MMINSSVGLLTVCGRHVALWRRPIPRHFSTKIDVLRRQQQQQQQQQQQNQSNIENERGRKLSPASLLKPGFQPTGVNKDGVYLGSTFLMLSPRTLPELDVAPLLNKTVFTRKRGQSIHGTDAAMRLSKAKNELREVIRQELEEPYSSTRKYNQNSGGVKKLYILRQHGVPNQLLQHLIFKADQWLEEKNALELWVDSTCHSSLSVFTTTGSSWRTLWPSEWDYDISLYLASMKRMVSHLGSMTPFCDGASVLPGDLEWKLSISRNNKLPLTLFPNDPEVCPVIEWVNPTATADSTERIGKIVIRMQGAPNPFVPMVGQDFLKQSHDVSLVFECEFKVAAEEA